MGAAFLLGFFLPFPVLALKRAFAARRDVDQWGARLAALERQIDGASEMLDELRTTR